MLTSPGVGVLDEPHQGFHFPWARDPPAGCRYYALSMRKVPFARERRAHLEEPLSKEENDLYLRSSGELGWITRQLRCDLAFENGVVQRSKVVSRVAVLIRSKQCFGSARRGADFRMRFWRDGSLSNGVIVHLADSGHANGTPEHDEKVRYRSVGGYFILVASAENREDEHPRLPFKPDQAGAAGASHLSEAVEAGDWIIVLIEEASSGKLDLRNWPSIIQQRPRVYVTDARSVYDYLQRDATSTSSDKARGYSFRGGALT